MTKKTVSAGKFVIAVSASLLLLGAAGCSSKKVPEWSPEKKKKMFRIATQQLAPEPVYNAVRWVRPPQVTPTRKIESSTAPIIMPIVNLSVQNRPLKEVILVIAAPTRYRTYCSSLIANQPLSLNMLGTIDELAAEIEKTSGINVVIDHENKEIRFLANRFVAPSFE